MCIRNKLNYIQNQDVTVSNGEELNYIQLLHTPHGDRCEPVWFKTCDSKQWKVLHTPHGKELNYIQNQDANLHVFLEFNPSDIQTGSV